jgi:hypothetical protein
MSSPIHVNVYNGRTSEIRTIVTFSEHIEDIKPVNNQSIKPGTRLSTKITVTTGLHDGKLTLQIVNASNGVSLGVFQMTNLKNPEKNGAITISPPPSESKAVLTSAGYRNLPLLNADDRYIYLVCNDY